MSLPGSLVELPTGNVYVHRSGEGPPLVLIHGYLISHWAFKPVIPLLAKHFEVIAIDTPGHGDSDRPAPAAFRYDVASIADAVDACLGKLGVHKTRVLGHSIGGAIAMTVAARHPERVERLVIADAVVDKMPLPLTGKIAMLPGIGKLIFKHAQSRRDMRSLFRNAHKDPDVCTEDFVDYFWEKFNRPGTRDAAYAWLETIVHIDRQNLEPEKVKCPTLLLWGAEDHQTPVAFAHGLQKRLPGTPELRLIDAAGHNPYEERPEAFVEAVLPFLLAQETSSAKAPARDAIAV